MTQTEALKLALGALEEACEIIGRAWAWRDEKGRPAITYIKEALAQPEQEYDWKDLYEKEKRRSAMWLAKYEEVAGPAPKAYPLAQPEQEPVTIWYMRDNHTFKKLSADVSIALIEIEQEFNEGYTYGMLCSKREGFPNVHASGEKKRLEFFAECKKVFEEWLPSTTPPQRKPLTWERVLEIGLECANDHSRLPYEVKVARAIEAAHGIKE